MDKQLLIVDDEPRLITSFKVILESRGFCVQTASRGKAAIDAYKKQPAKVVISDIQMPEMDGIQLMHALKQLDPCVQIILLTGYTSVENAAQALKQNNAFDYIAKPVKSMDNLCTLIERAQKKYDLEQKFLRQKQKNEKGFAIFKSIFDSMEAVVYVSDIQTHELIYTNKKFNERFHNGTPVPPGTKCWQVIQKDKTAPCDFCTNRLLVHPDGSPAAPYEWEFQNTKTGRWYNIVDKAIEWYDKRIVRLETAFDITEKKEHEKLFREFEKAIETAKKLESITTLAGGVAHDFNNTLSTIIGNINLAQLSCRDGETLKYLKNAEAGVMQAKDVSAQLIWFAKGGGPVKTRIDLKALIYQLLTRYEREGNITFSLDSDPLPDTFYADPGQLKVAFGNILQNAVDAMDGQGHISVGIRYEASNVKHSQIHVFITDTGCGIPSEHQDMIFNPYFTSKPMDSRKSTGLGLSIAWSNIARHGGTIHVQSSRHTGTTLQICLPVFNENHAEPTAGPRLEPAVKTDGHKSLAKVLIMDDDELILDVISQLLNRLGYDTVVALNSHQAVNICTTAKNAGKNIELALLDYDIQNGPGGFFTMTKLKKIDPQIKGLLITGHSDDHDIQGYRHHGFSDVIKKPFSIKQLNQKIKTLF